MEQSARYGNTELGKAPTFVEHQQAQPCNSNETMDQGIQKDLTSMLMRKLPALVTRAVSYLMGGYDDLDSMEYLIPYPLVLPMFDTVGS